MYHDVSHIRRCYVGHVVVGIGHLNEDDLMAALQDGLDEDPHVARKDDITLITPAGASLPTLKTVTGGGHVPVSPWRAGAGATVAGMCRCHRGGQVPVQPWRGGVGATVNSKVVQPRIRSMNFGLLPKLFV